MLKCDTKPRVLHHTLCLSQNRKIQYQISKHLNQSEMAVNMTCQTGQSQDKSIQPAQGYQRNLFTSCGQESTRLTTRTNQNCRKFN